MNSSTRFIESNWAVFLAYAVLAVALTWPLTAYLTTHVPMGHNDLWQTYWNFWWWKTALVERGQSPYFSDMIHYPQGAYLGLHTNNEGSILWTLPINVLFGQAAAYNLAVLGGFVLSGFGAYLLAREYVSSPGAAFLAGIVFAYFPQRVEQSLERLHFASAEGLPLFLWALVRTVRRGGHAWIPAGAFFALNHLLGFHNSLLALAMAVVVLGFESWGGPRPFKEVAFDLVKSGILATVLVSPFLWPMLRDMAERAAHFRKTVGLRPTDPFFWIVPHIGHLVVGRVVAPVYDRLRSFPSPGFTAYLGAVALALASAALPRRRLRNPGGDAPAPAAGRSPWRNSWLWTSSAAFFLVLSLGKSLVFAGTEFPRIFLPFRWLLHIPTFRMVRVPHRFLIPASLSLSILAAMGAASLAARWSPRRSGPLFAAFAALLVLDFMWIPYPMREIPRPDWVRLLDELPAGLAVFDVPGGHRARAAGAMLLQTYHRRPIVSGYVSTAQSHVSRLLEEFPVLRIVFQREPSGEEEPGPSLATAIRACHAGIVVVHLDQTVETIERIHEEVSARYPYDPYRILPYDPKEGMRASTLDRFRSELRREFGEPVRTVEGQVEIFLVPAKRRFDQPSGGGDGGRRASNRFGS